MRAVSAGRILVTLVALVTVFGAYIADWNATHIFNPDWPPHAKFHNAQTMLLGTGLGLCALVWLWKRSGDARADLAVATAFSALYWVTQGLSITFPGTAFFDPRFARPGPAPQPILDVVLLALLALGYALERRRLGTVASTA